MKKLVCTLVLTGLVTVPALALAEDAPSPLTANVSLTSNYVFRGVSQTQNGPAIQGGFDYAHPSGFYVGTWGSNVSWVSTKQYLPSGTGDGWYKNNNSMEIDLYGGYKGAVNDFGYDVGVITYYYPGKQISAALGATDPDTTELYLGGSWKFLSVKYSYTASDRFVGWSTSTGGKTRGSYYLELNANYDLGSGWGVMGHVGHQDVKDNSLASYTDYKVGVSKDVGFGTFALAYTDTNADTATYTWTTDANGSGLEKNADGHLFLSFSKSF